MGSTLCDIRETASRLSVSEQTVYRLKRSGELRAIYVRGALRFLDRDIEKYIEGLSPQKAA